MIDLAGQPAAAVLRAMVATLGDLDQDVDDAGRIDRIRLLEDLKAATAAAQARETAAFVTSQRAAQAAAGVPADRVGRGVAAQVGLARRISPYQARRYAGWSLILTRELPGTFALLRAGLISEWRALLVARETAWLSRAHRGAVDRELAPLLPRLGDRRVEAEARKIAYRLDPRGYLARIRGAEADRNVSVRPAPDAMCRLTALLPVARGIAAYAMLRADADANIGAGDARNRGQIMADTLVERLTGQAAAADVPLEVQLVMTDETLFGGGSEPAHLSGHGPLPAPFARDLALGRDGNGPRWLRRLFVAASDGELVAMESRRRCFTPAQRRFISARDQWCRTPWCEAPIRHVDHVVEAERGGPTSIDNGQCYCAACNHAKQAPGWRARPPNSVEPGIEITTPTGHTYDSRPPPPPRRAAAA